MSKKILVAVLIFIGLVLVHSALGQNPSVGQLILDLDSTSKTNHHPGTDVYVTKSMSTTGAGMVFEYDIKTPPVNNFDFVLAIDSSGSIDESNSGEQLKAINIAVPEFINTTLKKYYNRKNFNLSIISWNDNVDFAYSRSDQGPVETRGFNHIDPSTALPGPIGMVKADMDKGNPVVFCWPKADNSIFKSLPTDHTNFSVALKASMDILNNSAKYDSRYKHPVKFMILVSGESEYMPCNPSLIAAAKEKGYSIYAILMNPQPNSLSTDGSMFNHLTDITTNVNKVIPTPSVQSAVSPNIDLPVQLENALSQALQLAITEPVASGVVIVDPFYDYLVPTNRASIRIMKLDDSYREFNGQNNNGTLILRLPYDLPENNTTQVISYCNFVLRNLPTSASNGSAPILLSNSRNVSSAIRYTWLKTIDLDADLPAISMNLTSNVQIAPKGPSSLPANMPAKSSGFLSWLLNTMSLTINSNYPQG